jgi:hypothetical protein
LCGQLPDDLWAKVSATPPPAMRAAMQRSPASIAPLSRPCGIEPGTVATWRERSTVSAAPMRPKALGTTGLSPAAEALVVAFRRHGLLPRDDGL